MMTYDEMIAVIQAAKDGKIIQAKLIGEFKWFDLLGTNGGPSNKINFNFGKARYRVKPKERVFYIVPYLTGYSAFAKEADARSRAFNICSDVIKVQECID